MSATRKANPAPDVESMTRHELMRYLSDHVYPRSGSAYKDNVWAALSKQSDEILRNMARVTRNSERDRQAKRRLQAASRRKEREQHSKPTEPEPTLF